jgi:hypothetical protein
LARFVRSLRHKPTVTIVVRANSHRTPTNGTVATAKPTPINGARPVTTVKANGTRPKPKARPKPKPAWQQEWERLWDEVATALFGGPADAE